MGPIGGYGDYRGLWGVHGGYGAYGGVMGVVGPMGGGGGHLADGAAELALQDPLQRLQFLGGHLPTALQPLQQLHRPRDV